MSKLPFGLAADIFAANTSGRALPYKVTLVATYRCNFRCEMCSIWQKPHVGEMTPAEVESFFRRWSQFSWVHLTGGELFVRRDFEDIVAAVVDGDRSLFLLNFPTTGWFGDRTMAIVERVLRRGIGRLMVTISIDGPREVHDAMRGLPGSWDRAVETLHRLRGIMARNFQVVAGMTLFAKNAGCVDATIGAIRAVVPDFERTDLHLNIGHESAHYFANDGYLGQPGARPVVDAIEAHRAATGHGLHPVRFLEDRYQALVSKYYETGKSPLPCTALASSCFIDPSWDLYPCSIWNEPLGNLRERGFDLRSLWESDRTKGVRRQVTEEHCPHCWTPCEAYPTILGNVIKAGLTRHTPDNGKRSAR
jgi:MoaA/NifB/PqqE/SkfB family radical SAM enzyme